MLIDETNKEENSHESRKEENPLKSIKEEALEWKESLIRSEFLKLYFDSFGVNDSLTIERIVDINNYSDKIQNQNNFLFAIAKFEENSNYILSLKHRMKKDPFNKLNYKSNNFDCFSNFTEDQENLPDKSDKMYLPIIFPEEHSKKFPSSVNFLELAFSGFLNQNREDLFIENSTISQFFAKIKNKRGNKKLKQFNLDDMFKKDKDVNKIHNKIIENVFKDELKELRRKTEKEETYSLFLYKDGQLIEYISTLNAFNVIEDESINEGNLRERVLNHMISENQKETNVKKVNKTLCYENLVLFEECSQKPNQDTISLNFGEFFFRLIMTVLFILSFMLAVPENIFYENRERINSLFYSEIRGETHLEKGLVKSTIKNIFSNFCLDNKVNQMIDVSTILSGIMINFKNGKSDSKGEQIVETQSNYFGQYVVPGSSITKKNNCFKDTQQVFIDKTNYCNISEKLKLIDNDNLYELYLTFILFNSAQDIVLMDSIQFQFDRFGKITFKENFIGYKAFLNQGKIYISLIVINIIYLIFVVIDTIMLMNTFTNHIIDYFRYKVNSFSFSNWFDLIVYLLVLASQIWFYIALLWPKSKFPIVCEDEECFYKWFIFSQQIKKYLDFTGFCFLFLFIKLLKYLHGSLPPLAIVMNTFEKASKELISLFFLLIVSLIGMFFLFQSIFGVYSESFKTFGRSFLSIYLLFFGIFDYENDYEFYGHWHPLATYFWLVFCLIFQLIFCNVFLCLIRKTYKDVKQEKELTNQAVFEITKESFYGISEKFKNLILWKNPEEEKRKSNIVKEQKEVNTNQNNEGEEVVKKKKKPGCLQILKYNFRNLHITKLFNKNILSPEEFEENKKKNFALIRKKNMQMYVSELKRNTSEDFDILMDAIIYFIDTVLLCVILYIELRLKYMDEAQLFSEMEIQNSYFQEIWDTSQSQVKQDKKGEAFKDVFSRENIENLTKNFDNDCDKYTLNNGPVRITIRLYDYEIIDESFKSKYFTSGTKRDSFLEPKKCNINIEKTENSYKGLVYIPKNRGYKTLDNCGGYVLFCKHNTSSCDILNKSKDDFWESKEIGSMAADFLIFNKAHDFLLYNRITVLRNPNGEVKSNIDFNVIPFNRFVSENDFDRMEIEIIYYVFFLYFLFRLFGRIFHILHLKMNQDYENSQERENFKNSVFLNKFYRFSIDKYKKEKGFLLFIKIVFYTLWIFIYRTLYLIYLLIMSILDYIFEGFFNFIDCFSIGIQVGVFCLWFYLITLTNRVDVSIQTDQNANDIGKENIYIVNEIYAMYITYINWQATNLFLIFVRLLSYLRFSSAISLMFNIFQKSIITIVLYLIFLFFIDLGFVFFGYAVFSQKMQMFRTIGAGILNCFILLSGKIFPGDLMDLDNEIWTPIYIFFFFTINVLVLLNFFYAILIEGYSEAKDRLWQNFGKDSETDFFINIKEILVAKRKLYLEVSRRYQKNLKKSLVELMSVYKDFYEDIAILKTNEDNKKNSKGWWGDWLLKANKKGILYKTFKKLSKNCEKINNNEKSSNDKEEKLEILTDKVSIYHKFFLYALYLSKDKKIKEDDRDKESIKVQQVISEKEILVKEKKKDNKPNESKSNLWKIAFYKEYKKLISKETQSFFKQNIFEKYDYFLDSKARKDKEYKTKFNANRNLRLSKEMNLEQNDILFKRDIFFIPNVLSKAKQRITKLYNSSLCERENSCNETEHCKECSKMKDALNKISSEIYDIAIEYFLLPDLKNINDKDLYLGLYLEKIEAEKHMPFRQNINIDLPGDKINQFINKIKEILNPGKQDEVKKDELDLDGPGIINKPSYEINLFYIVWNTLYLIFFVKFPIQVKQFRKNSKAYIEIDKYYKNNKQNKETLYEHFFLNYLNTESNSSESNIKNQDLCEKKRFVFRKFSLGKDLDFNLNNLEGEAFFYFDNSKLLLKETQDEPSMKYTKREKFDFTPYKFEKYPNLFYSLWKETKFKKELFFGYNAQLNSSAFNSNKSDIFLLKTLTDSKKNKIEVYDYFLPEEKAEIIMMLYPPNKFIKQAKEILKTQISEPSNEIGNALNSIDTFSKFINFFKDFRVNLLLRNKIYTMLFDSYLKIVKEEILKINDKYNRLSKRYLREHGDKMSYIEKIAVARFFNLYMTLQRRKAIKKALGETLEDNQKNEMREETENHFSVDNIFKDFKKDNDIWITSEPDEKETKKKTERDVHIKMNPFLYILSLDNFDYLDLCQKIRDSEVKEFYLELYIYIYGPMDNQEQYYLKRKIKMSFIEKYMEYIDFEQKRNEILLKKNNLKQINSNIEQLFNYLEDRKEKYDKLLENWKNAKKILENEIKG